MEVKFMELEEIVEYVIGKYPQKFLEAKNGVRSSFDFLVNEVLKLSKGKADPAKVRAAIISKI